MTKAELVAMVAKKIGLPKQQVQKSFEVMIEGIIESLKTGEKVELRGFGSFRVRERGPRTGRNPLTGESVKVPAKRIPYFKPGKLIRAALLDRHGE